MTEYHVLFKEILPPEDRKRIEIGPDDTKVSGFLGNSTEVRKLLEGSKPDAQCNQVGCVNKADNSKPEKNCFCYICGYPINQMGGDEKKNPFGSQCEHVLACAQFAFLCGLGGIDYQKDINEILNETEAYGDEVISKFKEWRKGIIGANYVGEDNDTPEYTEDEVRKEGCSKGKGRAYKWAHPACNMIKSYFPFLRLYFDDDKIKLMCSDQLSPVNVAYETDIFAGAKKKKIDIKNKIKDKFSAPPKHALTELTIPNPSPDQYKTVICHNTVGWLLSTLCGLNSDHPLSKSQKSDAGLSDGGSRSVK